SRRKATPTRRTSSCARSPREHRKGAGCDEGAGRALPRHFRRARKRALEFRWARKRALESRRAPEGALEVRARARVEREVMPSKAKQGAGRTGGSGAPNGAGGAGARASGRDGGHAPGKQEGARHDSSPPRSSDLRGDKGGESRSEKDRKTLEK